MPIAVTCPNADCRRRLTFPEGTSPTQRLRCPHCRTRISAAEIMADGATSAGGTTAPGGAGEPAEARPVGRIERVVKWARRPRAVPALNILGASLYRAGRYAEALQTWDKGVPIAAGSNWYFMAMAHHRLGHVQEARNWLGRGNALYDQALREVGEELGEVLFGWEDRLELSLIRREAENLVLGAKPSPAEKNRL